MSEWVCRATSSCVVFVFKRFLMVQFRPVFSAFNSALAIGLTHHVSAKRLAAKRRVGETPATKRRVGELSITHLVLMISNCTAERSFSKMELMKSRLRTTMCSGRLSGFDEYEV